MTTLPSPPPASARSLSLSRVYEEHVLATGSLDERIFTGEGAGEDIGTPGPWLSEGGQDRDSATYRLHSRLMVRPHAAPTEPSDWPTGRSDRAAAAVFPCAQLLHLSGDLNPLVTWS